MNGFIIYTPLNEISHFSLADIMWVSLFVIQRHIIFLLLFFEVPELLEAYTIHITNYYPCDWKEIKQYIISICACSDMFKIMWFSCFVEEFSCIHAHQQKVNGGLIDIYKQTYYHSYGAAFSYWNLCLFICSSNIKLNYPNGYVWLLLSTNLHYILDLNYIWLCFGDDPKCCVWIVM